MSRLALSLLLLGAMAPAAQAEGKARSLGVTVSPLGAFAVTRMSEGVTSGMSGSFDWDYRKRGVWASMGGHVASSALFTEATPVRVRIGVPDGAVRPWIGLGASMLFPWAEGPGTPPGAPSLRLGGELSAGLQVDVSRALFVAAEGRYQNFSLESDPAASARQELASAYLGVGFQL